MAEEGAAVAILDCRDPDGEALAKKLTERGLKAAYWHCDVSREQAVERALDEVADTFGGLTVLVNNAGIAGANKPTHELTEEEWDLVQNVNVKGVFFCTKHAIPHMKKAGVGSIINLSSIYGLVSAPDIPPYHASKGAVRLMSKTDALLYATENIRCNSIHPGFIWTPLVETHHQTTGMDLEEAKKATAALHPVGHMGEPDDIAWGAVYLASDESKFVTGSELVIDGGYTAH
jgi:NAD(P)-dependent dehydrogenase (short-subunit alcohol dehydrogenase family)